MQRALQKLRQARSVTLEGGGQEKNRRQHEKGKLTARERIRILLDPGSFTELGDLASCDKGAPADGIVAGHGTVDGRAVCLFAQDPTVMGGTVGPAHGHKMYRTAERALEMRVPFIALHDSPGGRTQRPEENMGAFGVIREKHGGAIFFPNTQASGVIPQISVIMGSCAGISVYSAALTDFVFMVDSTSHMFVTGPRIVKSVIGEDISLEDLGGARVHARVSGVADLRAIGEENCLRAVRRLVGFLPQNNGQPPPVSPRREAATHDADILSVIPDDPRKPYDMRHLIGHIVDDGGFFELKPEFAAEIIVGFARLDGNTVGIVANQPLVKAGALTVNSSDKQARFMRFCDCFNIPIVLLVDTPAYLPGSDQEHQGHIRHGAKVLFAMCEATVPKITVVVRKCYGGGSNAMGVMAGMSTDLVFLWPTAELGAMGAEQSVDLFYGDEISHSPDPTAARRQRVEEYREKYANPIAEASASPYIDTVIEPSETRDRLIRSLQLLKSKSSIYRRQHSNMPL